MNQQDLTFYRGKRVFITGHTGFKGAWLCRILTHAGATITGYSLQAPTQPNLFELAGLEEKLTSIIGDIRDKKKLMAAFQEARPEVVFHLAAQPIVRDSYKDPSYTYETNVIGTVNILECVRLVPGVRSFLNITTDKVYQNQEWVWGYREEDPLDGFDPYSNSKSCSDLITHSYQKSFFSYLDAPAISTARAGNVIGGGDFANDRIVPDCVRAVRAGLPIQVRNPKSTRPYQHVLEPLFAYVMIAKRQCEKKNVAGWYNVGPDEQDCVTTEQLVGLFKQAWGEGFFWENAEESGAPHEANFLKLDCSKLRTTFGWRPRWRIQKAVEQTVAWTRTWLNEGNIPAEMDREIREYLEGKP